MQIEAGKYYRTRGGQVFGPMVRDEDDGTIFHWCLVSSEPSSSWAEDGRWMLNNRKYPFDLVAEVYVSDTPQVNTTKTARDELGEKAALAILTGHYSNPSLISSDCFADIWVAAEHFVEARKK